MAKSVRGLPADFALNLPEDRPVTIGDFLDEAPPVHTARRSPVSEQRQFTPHVVAGRIEEERGDNQVRPVPRKAQPSKIIRYQLNLSPKANAMFEDLLEHVRNYSPESDARASEVFQGVIGLLHVAMDELELSELPRRGAWGSVTAKNFPGSLGEAFERAIVRSATKRGGRTT